MDNKIQNIINQLQNKTLQISQKRVLNQKDLSVISKQIDLLNNEFKHIQLDSQSQQNTTLLLQEVVKTIISTPTNSPQSYKMKKQFLANTPNALYHEIPNSLSKRFIAQNQLVGGQVPNNLITNPNQPPNVWNNSPQTILYQNQASFPGVVGCLGSVNGCGHQPLISNTQGYIECGNMYNQGGQQFIYPTKIKDI